MAVCVGKQRRSSTKPFVCVGESCLGVAFWFALYNAITFKASLKDSKPMMMKVMTTTIHDHRPTRLSDSGSGRLTRINKVDTPIISSSLSSLFRLIWFADQIVCLAISSFGCRFEQERTRSTGSSNAIHDLNRPNRTEQQLFVWPVC